MAEGSEASGREHESTANGKEQVAKLSQVVQVGLCNAANEQQLMQSFLPELLHQSLLNHFAFESRASTCILQGFKDQACQQMGKWLLKAA